MLGFIKFFYQIFSISLIFLPKITFRWPNIILNSYFLFDCTFKLQFSTIIVATRLKFTKINSLIYSKHFTLYCCCIYVGKQIKYWISEWLKKVFLPLPFNESIIIKCRFEHFEFGGLVQKTENLKKLGQIEPN